MNMTSGTRVASNIVGSRFLYCMYLGYPEAEEGQRWRQGVSNSLLDWYFD